MDAIEDDDAILPLATSASAIKYVNVTVGIVTAYISNNSVSPSELAGLITQVHAAVITSSDPVAKPITTAQAPKPAEIKKSIMPDALISFIDGKPYKTLKRHLGTHGLDFDAYRARFGLPADYPTVSADYSANRATFAKKLGLGKRIGRNGSD